jgi:CheY-like chemotaxis protein
MPQSRESAVSAQAAVPDQQRPAHFRVLIVDDDPLSRELLADCLQSLDVEIHQAHDGLEALDVIEEARPDLMLVDIQMPRMDGFALLKELRSRNDTRSIPIFAISAFAMAGDAERALARGFNQYITKPVSVGKLRKLVRGLLNRPPDPN